MKISVILCTYNRCQNLATALASVAASTLSNSAQWEVLVVDNNSNDQTREVVEVSIRQYPGRFRYVLERHQGLSHARNTGIREARGDVLAFMDDDVTVDPTWLNNLTAALHSSEWVGSGGRVLPAGTFLRPRWLGLDGRYGLAPLAIFDLGDEARELTEPPFGANMAYRKEMFEKYGGFRTDLGRCGGSMLSNEDTEFGRRLIAGGERLRYEPSAVVYHPVPENRLQKEYFLGWWFDKARADVREFGTQLDTRWIVAGIPLYFFRRLSVWILRWLVAVQPVRRFSCKLKVWGLVGSILESHHQSRDPKRPDDKRQA
jgi:glycosyltransferase involved in cell wall biosynthesis